MTSAYTPGLWRLDPHGCGDSPAIVRVFPCGDSEPIAVPVNSGFADLQLMSSAPDLLAALESALEAVEYYDEREGAGCLLDQVRDAIAKATGGAA
jgi:hypothetical protein